MAATGFEGKFALSPISQNGAKGSFLIFDTPAEAEDFMKDLQSQNADHYQKLILLKPEIRKVILTEVGIFPATPESK